MPLSRIEGGARRRTEAPSSGGCPHGQFANLPHHSNNIHHSSSSKITAIIVRKLPLTTQTSVVLSESDRRIDTVLRRRVQTPDPSGRRDTYVRKQRQNGNDSTAIHRAEPRRLSVLRRRPSSDRKSGARPGGPCRSVGGRVPGARRISPASHSEPAGVPICPFRESKGARTSEASARGMPEPRAGRPTWSRQTSTPVRRRREATAREKPEKLIQGRRRTPRANLSAPFENRRGRARAKLVRGGCPPLFHARGLATRAATGQRTLAV